MAGIRRSFGRGKSVFAAATVAVAVTGCAADLGKSALATSSVTPAAPVAVSETKQKPLKMALLLPLGGFDSSAVVAKGMKQAAELALFEIDNPAVQLTVKDDKGTAEGARAAAEEAIKDGAEIIIGPLFAKSVAGAAAVARPANVPLLAFSNDRTVAGNGVYLMSFLVESEVDRIVSVTTANGRKRFAALIPDDAYGRAVEPAFRDAVARAGGTIAELKVYPVEANGMIEPSRAIVEAIKTAEANGNPIDALFVPGGQDTLPQLGPLIAISGVDTSKVKLIGTGSWDFPNIGREQAFVGGWYPSPDPSGWRNFSERFGKTFGSAPPRIATLAYDAVQLAVSLSSNAPGTRFTVANLTRTSGFNGVDGPVRFVPQGLSERGLAVLEVQPFATNVVEPAPTTFSATKLSEGPPPPARTN